MQTKSYHNLLLLVLLLLFGNTFTSSAQKKNPAKMPGTVEIDDQSSMDATEITIKEWMEFIVNNDFDPDMFPNPEHISRSARVIFEDLKLKENSEYFEIIKNHFYSRNFYGEKTVRTTKKFQEVVKADTNIFSIFIPITGITFKQAQSYCKWREDLLNKISKIKVKVSLPPVEVYEKVIENRDSVNTKGCYMLNSFNCKCISATKDNKGNLSQGKALVRADAYWPNDYGLYCLQGNAAEMTNTEGIAMGGSYKDYARFSFNDVQQKYTGPEEFIGFRCYIRIDK